MSPTVLFLFISVFVFVGPLVDVHLHLPGPLPASCLQVSFIGDAGAAWDLGSSWSSGQLPTSADDVFVNNSVVLIQQNSNISIHSLSINLGNGDQGAFVGVHSNASSAVVLSISGDFLLTANDVLGAAINKIDCSVVSFTFLKSGSYLAVNAGTPSLSGIHMSLSASNHFMLTSLTAYNDLMVDLSGGSSIVIPPGATASVHAAAANNIMLLSSDNSGTVINNGLMAVDTSSGGFIIGTAFINAQSGTLQMAPNCKSPIQIANTFTNAGGKLIGGPSGSGNLLQVVTSISIAGAAVAVQGELVFSSAAACNVSISALAGAMLRILEGNACADLQLELDGSTLILGGNQTLQSLIINSGNDQNSNLASVHNAGSALMLSISADFLLTDKGLVAADKQLSCSNVSFTFLNSTSSVQSSAANLNLHGIEMSLSSSSNFALYVQSAYGMTVDLSGGSTITIPNGAAAGVHASITNVQLLSSDQTGNVINNGRMLVNTDSTGGFIIQTPFINAQTGTIQITPNSASPIQIANTFTNDGGSLIGGSIDSGNLLQVVTSVTVSGVPVAVQGELVFSSAAACNVSISVLAGAVMRILQGNACADLQLELDGSTLILGGNQTLQALTINSGDEAAVQTSISSAVKLFVSGGFLFTASDLSQDPTKQMSCSKVSFTFLNSASYLESFGNNPNLHGIEMSLSSSSDFKLTTKSSTIIATPDLIVDLSGNSNIVIPPGATSSVDSYASNVVLASSDHTGNVMNNGRMMVTSLSSLFSLNIQMPFINGPNGTIQIDRDSLSPIQITDTFNNAGGNLIFDSLHGTRMLELNNNNAQLILSSSMICGVGVQILHGQVWMQDGNRCSGLYGACGANIFSVFGQTKFTCNSSTSAVQCLSPYVYLSDISPSSPCSLNSTPIPTSTTTIPTITQSTPSSSTTSTSTSTSTSSSESLSTSSQTTAPFSATSTPAVVSAASSFFERRSGTVILTVKVARGWLNMAVTSIMLISHSPLTVTGLACILLLTMVQHCLSI